MICVEVIMRNAPYVLFVIDQRMLWFICSWKVFPSIIVSANNLLEIEFESSFLLLSGFGIDWVEVSKWKREKKTEAAGPESTDFSLRWFGSGV